ncbi:MAG: cyclic nucleotide-gated ion channel, partial [Pseudomonadota bacterium]
TRYSPAMASLASVVRAEGRTLISAMLLMLITVMVASTLMYEVERDAQPEAFSSIPAALWWGIITLTTVGYGDIVPVTDLGRALGALFMFLGVGLFALPAAILAAGFAREIRRHDFVVSMNRLLRVPILAKLDAATLANLTVALVKRAVPARHALLRPGDPADALYIVVEGQLDVTSPRGSRSLHEGDFFGESALIGSDHPLDSTVTTITECQLLVLSAEDCAQLASDDPVFAERLKELVDRHRGPAARTPD